MSRKQNSEGEREALRRLNADLEHFKSMVFAIFTAIPSNFILIIIIIIIIDEFFILMIFK